MWRYRGECNHCGQNTQWRREEEQSRREVIRHLEADHGLAGPEEPADYRLLAEHQCDYCLEPYLDDCTKCRHDFCAAHAGDIDGLCGGCI